MSNPTATPDPIHSPDPAQTDELRYAPTQPLGPAESTAQPAPAAGPAAPGAGHRPAASARHRPRFGTMLWGALFLGLAVFIAAWTLFPGRLDPTLWLLAAVIGVGLVLVVAGIAAATRRTD